jgi:hypothetical protein
MYNYFVQSLVLAPSAARKCIKSNDHGVVWTPQLSALTAESRKALYNWQASGCPTSGVLLDNMRCARCIYKNAIKERKLSRNRSNLLNMGSCIGSSNSRVFWKQWNKHKGLKCQLATNLVASDFVNGFKQNFVVSSHNNVMLHNFVSQYADTPGGDSDNIMCFTVDDVVNACSKLSVSNCLDCNDCTTFSFCSSVIIYVVKGVI